MIKLKNPSSAREFFAWWEETIIWTCLQGQMGEIWADRTESPHSALALFGKFGAFGFLAGQANLDFIKHCREKDVILVPQDQAWVDLIEEHYGERAKVFTRYATKKDTVFDREKLEKIIASLPADYELKLIEAELYQACLSQPWSQDLVGNYDDYDHYAQAGLGIAVLYKGQLVSAASSFSSYDMGYEIEIDTHVDFRRRGLAKIVGAKFILESLDRDRYPSWDAHNQASIALAQQLGYEFSHEYLAYWMDW